MNYGYGGQPRLTGLRALVLGGIASVLVVLLIVIFRVAIPQGSASEAAVATQKGNGKSVTESIPETKPPDPELVLQEEIKRARAVAAIVGLRSRAQEVSQDHQMLVAELSAFRSETEDLLTNEDGFKLASSEEHLNVFVSLSGKQRISEARLETLKTQLEKLMAPVLRILAEHPGEAVTLPDGYAGEIEKISEEIRPELETLRQDQKLLAAIMRFAESQPAATLNLEQTLARRDAEQLQLTSARVAAARQAELEKSVELLEQAAKEHVVTEINLKLAQMESERLRVVQKEDEVRERAEAEEKAFEAAQAKLMLERELAAEMAVVESMLSPFIYEDASQIHSRSGFVATIDPTLASFSRLQGAGALNETFDGLDTLYKLGNSSMNGRPRGGFPSPYKSLALASKPEVKEGVLKAQRLLIKYGPLLVEQGLLAP